MDLPSSTYTIGWVLWIAAFVVLEAAAVVDKDDGDTLTEHVRKWLRLQGHGILPWLGRGALAVALVWLLGHFWR